MAQLLKLIYSELRAVNPYLEGAAVSVTLFASRDRNQLFVEIIYKEKNICKENHFHEK